MPTITIRTDEGTKRAYEASTDEQKRQVELMVKLGLRNADRAIAVRELQVLMDDIGREAADRGLTSEILESILNEK